MSSVQQVLSDIGDSGSASELWDCVHTYCVDLGVQRISYHHYPGVLSSQSPAAPPVSIIAEGFPEEWVCHYINEKLYLVDPITELARTSGTIFQWEDVGSLMRLTQSQKDYIGELREAEIGNGVAFQVYGPGMRNGYVGLGFDVKIPVSAVKYLPLLQCVAQAAHLRYCTLTPEAVTKLPKLSPREQEVLGWIAQGKSNSVIASILGVSAHTVDTMVRRLYAKLDVADRTTAAIRGIGAGLILPAS